MTGKVFDEENRIKYVNTLEKYVFGGKGKIDLVAPSGTSHQYSFEVPKDPKFPGDVRFVYALHEGKKFYLGMIEHRHLRLTSHSRFDKAHDVVKGAYYIVDKVNNAIILERLPMKFYHDGRCAMCGREFKVSKYKKIGLGKKCLKRYEELVVPYVGERTSDI